jgi:arylsulfatase A-like enzyme
MKKRPNIIILNPDQMRADSMHHLGNQASVTPVLDALAEEGASFSRTFCQNPVYRIKEPYYSRIDRTLCQREFSA